MVVCVRMVGQELRACVQYRPPLQCSRQRCTGPRRAVPQQPPACPRAHHEGIGSFVDMSCLHVAGGWGWRVQGSAAVRPADFAPTV